MKTKGLTIQEAIEASRETGRWFKWEDWDDDSYLKVKRYSTAVAATGEKYSISSYELLSQPHWMLKPEKLEPVSFETEVVTDSWGLSSLSSSALDRFIGKRVRVAVEECEEES